MLANIYLRVCNTVSLIHIVLLFLSKILNFFQPKIRQKKFKPFFPKNWIINFYYHMIALNLKHIENRCNNTSLKYHINSSTVSFLG